MIRKFIFLTTLFLLAFGGGNLWAQSSELTVVSNKVWDFEEADGFPAKEIAEIAVIDNLELVANSSRKMSFDNVAKSYTEGEDTYSFTRQLKFGGTFASDASYRVVHFKAAAGTTINVFGATGKSGTERSAAIRVVALGGKFSDGEEKETLTSSNNDLVKGTFFVDTDHYPSGADVWVYSKNSGFNISGIEVTILKETVTLSNAGQPTSYTYVGDASDTKNYEISYTTSSGNLEASDDANFVVTSSNNAVLDASAAEVTINTSEKKFNISNLQVKSAGAATLTFTFKGNSTYSETSISQVFTISGKQTYSIKLEDLTIQQSQRRTIMPVITNANGKPIGFDASGNVVEMADDDDPVDYDQYFDFTYSLASISIVTLDGNVVQAGEQVGGPVVVTVTAQPKSGYDDKFTNNTASGTLNVTVTERTTGMYFDFYLDKACTTKVQEVYSVTLPSEESSTTIVHDFPNGRVVYLKVNSDGEAQNVKEIWFSTGKNKIPVAVSRYVRDGEARTIYKDDPSKSQYLYKMDGGALPIYIDEALGADPYVFVNVQCYKDVAGSIEQAGSVIPVKFNIVSHTRPAVVTYDPSAAGTHRSTAQSVDAIGTSGSGNAVYGKFSSTGTNYTIEGLLNEPHVIYDIERTGVFSTEVAGRKISGVQIYSASDGDYVSTMSTNNYWYHFATTLNLSQYTYHENVGTESIEEPTVTATYYDKVKKQNIDASSGSGINITYSVANYNGAEVSVNESTGEITLGGKSGMAIVTVRYENVNDITVNKRTSTMEVAEAKYTIYLTNVNEKLPTINPDSKTFYPEQLVTITAHSDSKAYYTIDGSDPTTPGTRISLEEGANGTYTCNSERTMTVGQSVTVKAVSYDDADPENVVYSKVISETYTLAAEVLPPYFVPDGITSAYYYYTETLGVEARTRTTGSTVYYTISHGGSSPEDPVIGASGTQRYDGLQGITLTEGGTYKIKAIAFKDGIQSDVVEATYIYSSISAPYFDVNGTGNYTSGEHAVTTSDLITIGSNVVPSTGTTLKHYYTLDGTDPAEDGGTLYTGGFTLVKTVTAKAYSVLVDASGNEVQQSAVTTVEFTITSPLDVWEAVAQTTPDGSMLEADGFIISKDSDVKSIYSDNNNNAETKVNLNSLSTSDGGSGTKTYAQADITVTFGGYEVSGKGKNWTNMLIADPAVGSPIDGVGAYNIAGPDNAKMEEKNTTLKEASDNYNHLYTELSTTHEKTFKLPCKGAFVKFEPEKDGDITIWALQHGSLNYQDGITLCDKFIRYRPVYFIDEQGKSYTATSIESSARLSAEWAKIEATAAANSWTGWREKQTIIHQGTSMDVENKGLNASESQAIYNMYKKYITDNNIKIGDPIKPFPVHNGSTISTNNGNYTDSSDDGTGYVMLTGGYVKYTFSVKAGKTYYFFGQGTKIGIRGFRFTPTEDVSARPEITMHARNNTTDARTVSVKVGNAEAVEKVLSTVVGDYANQTVNVTLDRTFTANTWTSLVLPFSVSATQLEKIFGAKAEVTHLKDITADGRTLVLKTHRHQMIVAGTPIFFYPRKTVDKPKFEGVRLEASSVEDVTGPHDDYSMIGTFVRSDNSLHRFDYYFGTDGKLYRYDVGESTTDLAVQGTRTWLRPKNPSAARELSFFFEGYDDDDVTGIIEIVNNSNISNKQGVSAIYNLSGQKVSDGSLDGLSKGVYIVNGKKRVIK